jgi:beta-carotene 15,15'-dioxygenase
MDMVKNWANTIGKTPTLVSIILGSLLLIWQQLNGGLTPALEIGFFVFFLAISGIPHGAIDHLVEKETAQRQQKTFNLFFFLAKYLLTMAFYGLVWYFIPSFSLLFFLLISAWHFGETDIEKAPPTLLWNITRFTFGSFVLFWILLNHASETTPIMARISQKSENVVAIWSFFIDHRLAILLISGFIFCLFHTLSYLKTPITIDKNRLVRLSLILILTYFLPLLPAFALYFGGWHALSSFKTIQEYLVANQNANSKYTFKSTFQIWTKTLFFTALAVIFMAFAAWYWLHFQQTWDPLPLVFIFLSLITLPHLNVMHGMNKANV